MADWKRYKDYVHNIGDKINYIDPNDLLISNNAFYNDIKDASDEVRHTWAPEDYCIDVDICMEVSSRGDYAHTVNDIFLLNWDGKSGHISLQSGQRFYYGANTGKDNWDLKQNMSSGGEGFTNRSYVNYMSSRDIGVNFQDIMTDYLSTEMLGIESIRIEYINNFCPKVTISMTDVQGIGIFSPLERSHTKVVNGVSGYDRNDIAGSFYRALFNLPYPKVTMKVKGLYGAPVTFDLTFVNISNDFNSGDGNYKIELTLLGYYYSFLNNVPLMHCMMSPYFYFQGNKYWNDVICKNQEYFLDGVPPITMMEFVKRVSNAQIKIDNNRTNGVGAAGKVALNDKLQKTCMEAAGTIAEIYQSYVQDLQVACTTDPVLSRLADGIIIDAISNNDILMGFAVSTPNPVDPSSISLASCINHQNAFASVPEDQMKTPALYKKLERQVASVRDCMNRLGGFTNFHMDIEMFEATRSVMNSSWRHALENAEAYNVVRNTIPDHIPSVSNYATCSNITLYSISNKQGVNSVPFDDTLRKIYTVAQESVKDLTSLEKSENTKIINDSIGFTPSIKNIVKLLMEHCECYFNSLYTLSSVIGYSAMNGRRDIAYLGLDRNTSDFRTPTVPPFPEVSEIQDGKRVHSWTGSLPQKDRFAETGFINSLVKACNDCITYLNQATRGQGSFAVQYNLGYDGDESQPVDNLPVRRMYVPLTFSDLMIGGKAFQNLTEGDIDGFVNEGNMSAIITVVYVRLLQLLNGHPSGRTALSENDFSKLGTADAYNFFEQFSSILSNQFTIKIQDVISKSNFTDLMVQEACGEGHKDFDANEPLLTNYYQNTVGFAGDELINGNYYCIPSNNLNGENNIKYSQEHNRPEDEVDRKANLSTKSVIGLYDVSIEDFPVAEADDRDDFRDYSNYLLIDRTGKNVRYFAESQSKFNDKFGDVIQAKLVQYSDIFTPYEEKTDDFVGLCPAFNSGVGGSDNIATSKEALQVGLPHSFPNPSEENRANFFGSSVFFSTLNKSVKERAVMFAAGPMMSSPYEAGESEWIIDDAALRDALSHLQEGRANVSNAFVLAVGAVCWAHFFNNDKMYSIRWKYVSEFYKAYHSFTNKAEDLSRWEELSDKNTVVKSPNIKYNRIAYVLALYFNEWAGTEYVKLENQVNANHGNFLNRLTTVSDMSDFAKNRENWEALGLKIEADGFSFKLQENSKQMIIDSMSQQISTFCYIPVNDGRYGNGERNNYLKSFFIRLHRLCADRDAKSAVVNTSSTITGPSANATIDHMVASYRTTKTLWDGWLSGARQRENDSFVLKNWMDINFFNERFHFIDSFYNDISDDCLINAQMVSELFSNVCGQQQNWTLLTFISEIMRKSNVSFFNIQNWANLCDSASIAKAFVPMSYYESHNLDDPNSQVNNTATNSDFVFIYLHQASNNIGTVGDADRNDNKGDGFIIDVNDNMRDLPPEIGYNMRGQWRIPAFAVTYGKQYQSYFSDIKVHTKKGVTSDWAIKAYTELAKLGNDKISDSTMYVGQDLYTVFSNQCFTVTVTMLGCCWVQPLMYFVLLNVPMYRGTYIVYKVTHQITNGSMTTTFEGYKMSRFANRFVDNANASCITTVNVNADTSVGYVREAEVQTECAYRVYPIGEETSTTMNFCNTVNVDLLKKFKPSYLDGKTMWEWILENVNRCSVEDEMEVKLVALTILNMFVENYKQNDYNDNKDCWEDVVLYKFKPLENIREEEPSEDVQFWCEDVFEDPICSFEELNLNIPAGPVTPVKREGDEIVDDLDNPAVECEQINAHYKTISDDSEGTYTSYGNKQEQKQEEKYPYKTKIEGTIGTQQPERVSEDFIRAVCDFRPASVYMNDSETENSDENGNPTGLLDCGWEKDFALAYGVKPEDCKVFLRTDKNSPVWEIDEFDKFSRDEKQILTDSTTLADRFVEAIEKSVESTESLYGMKLETVFSCDNIVVLSMADEDGIVPINNHILFDMLVQAPEGNLERGYFGKFKRISWVTDALSSNSPKYIVVEVSDIDIAQPDIYLHSISDSEIAWNNDEVIEELFSSNCVSTQNCDDSVMKAVSPSIWKIMGKNMAPDTDYKTNRNAIAFSCMFGGTDFYDMKWGDVNTENTVSYFLQQGYSDTVECVVPTDDDNHSTDKGDITGNETVETFNTESFHFFEPTHPQYESRTLYGSHANKLELDSTNTYENAGIGNFSNTKHITSHWALCRSRNSGEGKPHMGTDFTSYTNDDTTVGNPHGSMTAIYDGIVLGVYEHNPVSNGIGFGFILTIAYNIQLEVTSNGKKENRTVVCSYCHIDNKPNFKSGDVVHKGDLLGKIGKNGGKNYNGDMKNHLHLCFLTLPNDKFKDSNAVATLYKEANSYDIISKYIRVSDFNRDCWDYIAFPASFEGWMKKQMKHNDEYKYPIPFPNVKCRPVDGWTKKYMP